jgi:hypothetical protein
VRRESTDGQTVQSHDRGNTRGVWVAAHTKLVVVDVTAVAESYRMSTLRSPTVLGPGNQKIGPLHELLVWKSDDALFAIIQVGTLPGCRHPLRCRPVFVHISDAAVASCCRFDEPTAREPARVQASIMGGLDT